MLLWMLAFSVVAALLPCRLDRVGPRDRQWLPRWAAGWVVVCGAASHLYGELWATAPWQASDYSAMGMALGCFAVLLGAMAHGLAVALHQPHGRRVNVAVTVAVTAFLAAIGAWVDRG